MEITVPSEKLGFILKVGLYVLMILIGLNIFPLVFSVAGLVIMSTLGTFTTAAVANAVTIRVFERGNLVDVGLGWSQASKRNLSLGILAGMGAALLITVVPLITGAASLERDPTSPNNWPALIFLTFVLIFGAVGEEMLFHGYGFQLLIEKIGVFATILPVSILFALAHSYNNNVSTLGLINTFGFGVVLGYGLVRSGDLWLPIGIHFGWNWILPLFGANLSGFKMNVTGYVMHWRTSDLWSGGQYGPEGSILTCAIVVALFVYLQKAPVQKQPLFLLRSHPEA